MSHGERKARLEALLLGFQRLWRPQPFRVETPEWCADHPVLTAELLGLDDDTVERLGTDNEALIALVGRFVPEVAELAGLIDLPTLTRPSGPPSPLKGEGINSPSPSRGEGLGKGWEPTRLYTDIPGRKQAQIAAYAAALGEPRAPILEWCSGKGHLGRLLAHRWHWPVASLEIDATLCEAGADLARHAQVDCMQHFIPADALAATSVRHLAGRHAIALHACGDLHTRLVAGAVEQASPAIDIAPCCYYRTVHETYRPFHPTPLTLNRDDLRLAVTETVTASAKQRRQSRQALAWKLGWVELRQAYTGEAGYKPFPPVPEAWLRGTFAEFIERMSERAGFVMPAQAGIQSNLAGLPPQPALECIHRGRERQNRYDHYETLGQARAARMLRLQLVRLAFRRALEVWLLMDMAVFLEEHGYAVAVAPFCVPGLTPRNLLLSARRYT
ncbi:MAG: methyltransferase [Thiobacillus sp.]|nr:methyltransferase [Thiobacillus sp.]